jgi:hypothetical protein
VLVHQSVLPKTWDPRGTHDPCRPARGKESSHKPCESTRAYTHTPTQTRTHAHTHTHTHTHTHIHTRTNTHTHTHTHTHTRALFSTTTNSHLTFACRAQVKRRTKKLSELFRSYHPHRDKKGRRYTVLAAEESTDKLYWVAHNKCYDQVRSVSYPAAAASVTVAICSATFVLRHKCSHGSAVGKPLSWHVCTVQANSSFAVVHRKRTSLCSFVLTLFLFFFFSTNF